MRGPGYQPENLYTLDGDSIYGFCMVFGLFRNGLRVPSSVWDQRKAYELLGWIWKCTKQACTVRVKLSRMRKFLSPRGVNGHMKNETCSTPTIWFMILISLFGIALRSSHNIWILSETRLPVPSCINFAFSHQNRGYFGLPLPSLISSSDS